MSKFDIKDGPMQYEIVVESVAEQPIAAARQRTALGKISKEIGDLLGRSWAFLKDRSGLRTDGHKRRDLLERQGRGLDRGGCAGHCEV